MAGETPIVMNSPGGGDPLLGGLTEPQQRAVTHVEGPLLVLAGAGSGKTRVITRRVAYLIQRVGVRPWQVLAITFTNKASGEMRERVGELVTPRQAAAVTVSTFHSLCARLIRQHADVLGLPSGYSIYDSADQNRAMKQALTEAGVHSNNFPPGKVLAAISQAKNELKSPQEYEAEASDFNSRSVAGLYKYYQAVLEKNQALDFDDLLLKAVTLVKDHPTVLAELRERFGYVLIDEYQDTNRAQFVLAHALCAQHQNICATGDPDQSIYGWRGADLSNILDFESHFPQAEVVRLEQNYRSTKCILAAADALIKQNRRRKHKSLWTENEQGEKIVVIRCQDGLAEADWVASWLTTRHEQDEVAWSDMAVFYRVNSLSRVIEDALRTANIPYQIARGTAFYDRKEIKDALAYLRVISNPADEVNLLRIINTPARGISAATVKALQGTAVSQQTTVIELLKEPDQVPGLNTRAVNSVRKFAALLDGWRSSVDAETNGAAPTLRDFVERVIRESGLEGHYRNDPSDPEQERLMNLGELVSSAQQFDDEQDDSPGEADEETGELAPPAEPETLAWRLSTYLERVSLVSDIDGLEDSGQGAVTLMTLHAAKGLEFHTVVMLAAEDGLLPHARALVNPREMEEERRLCFVGITRSMRRLAMTHTRFRTVFGQTKPSLPSRFLDELPREQVEQQEEEGENDGWGRSGGGYMRRGAGAFSDMDGDAHPPDDQDDLAPGTVVRHERFGLGKVIQVEPGPTWTRARVAFDRVGVKTLVVQLAGLEKV